MSTEMAIKDFQKRISNYELTYQSLSPEEGDDISFVKVLNIGKQVSQV
jgi:hypothetical protein